MKLAWNEIRRVFCLKNVPKGGSLIPLREDLGVLFQKARPPDKIREP